MTHVEKAKKGENLAYIFKARVKLDPEEGKCVFDTEGIPDEELVEALFLHVPTGNLLAGYYEPGDIEVTGKARILDCSQCRCLDRANLLECYGQKGLRVEGERQLDTGTVHKIRKNIERHHEIRIVGTYDGNPDFLVQRLSGHMAYTSADLKDRADRLVHRKSS
jgi:hypothetical protein